MSAAGQPEALETELIRSLFENPMPAIIMSVAFMVSGTLIVFETGDRPILALLIIGLLFSLVRLAIGWHATPRAIRSDLTLAEARHLERHFGGAYIAFAGALGLFGYRAMWLPSAQVHMLLICLLVGYGAGVAASVALRPRIAIPSMTAAVVPAIIAALAKPHPLYWATGLLTAAFLTGGVNAVCARHRRATRSIGRRIAFAALARQDVLTALPNRLALREWFDQQIGERNAPPLVAVHYLDLNGFKPVNDKYGHPVGDALLVAVSRRIARTVRLTDIAARLGGDEFAVVQCGIAHPDEAEWLARRLVEAIGRPYSIEGQTITVSTCIGFVTTEEPGDLEYLLSLADEALYDGKRSGSPITRWESLARGRAAA